MAGAVAIVIALLLFPVLFLMGMALVAGLLGGLVDADARKRFEGSELVQLNR